VYRNRTGGTINNYSTIGGVCKLCISSFPSPPPPPPGPTGPTGSFIQFTFTPQIIPFVFRCRLEGSGTVDYGNSILIPFNETYAPGGYFGITGIVQPNNKVTIYSSDITTLDCSEQPVISVNASTLPTITLIDFTTSSLVGGFDVSKYPNSNSFYLADNNITGLVGIPFLREPLSSLRLAGNSITQANANDIATQLATLNFTNVIMQIESQRNGTIDTNTAPFLYLKNTLDWTIY
jgi:hypothetical protein